MTAYATLDINPTGTTSALGRTIRLRRLFGATGRTVTVALDQAVPRGVAPRLAGIAPTYDGIVAAGPDAVTMFKGIAGHVIAHNPTRVPWILKASTFSVDFHAHYDAVVATVSDAIRLGAEAVAVGISAGSSNQARDLELLSGVVESAGAVGLPVVCHAYPSGELWEDRKGSVEAILYAARAAAELGVDVVKTWYSGSTETFREIVEGTPAIVVAAGGAKADSPLQVLRQAASVIEAGGRGVTFGRNVWGAEDPGKMVRALRAVVHEDVEPEKAAELLK
ncbi:class I fructose-bisphosphate aldolase [Nonomuraea sp. NPDC050022]|uniref:class I fructose-bisphosphate aldolase n=1 Tax=Nonomuraea sp. NPDC050022 TaxID=3364358 RepID=UPI0037A7B91A